MLVLSILAVFGLLRLSIGIMLLTLSAIMVITSQLIVECLFSWNSKILSQKYHNAIKRYWFEVMNYVCFGKTDIHLTGKDFPLQENAILIANHQIDSDWWYLWCFANKFQRHGDIRIGLKEELKYVPIYGWGMYFFDFLFLSRNWEKDQQTMRMKFEDWSRKKAPLWFLIFPEGTTISNFGMEKGKIFAEKQKRPIFQHLLLPRTTGLLHSIKELKSHITAVYDVTIAYQSYSGEIPTYEMGYTRNKDKDIPSFRSVLEGKFPEKVFMHVVRYDLSQIPTDDKEFTVWLDRIWKEKDERLEYFIHNQSLQYEDDHKYSQTASS